MKMPSEEQTMLDVVGRVRQVVLAMSNGELDQVVIDWIFLDRSLELVERYLEQKKEELGEA